MLDRGGSFETSVVTRAADGELSIDWHVPEEAAIFVADEICNDPRDEMDEQLAEQPLIRLLLAAHGHTAR